MRKPGIGLDVRGLRLCGNDKEERANIL